MTNSYAKWAGEKSRLRLAVLLSAILAALLVMMVALAPKADAAIGLRDVGPVDAATGFPEWYQDANGLRLALCSDAVNCGMNEDPDQFYYGASASGTNGAATASVDMTVAATLASPDPAVTTSSIGITARGLQINKTYRVSYPYGVRNLSTDGRGQIRFVQDIGCVPPEPGVPGPPCNFRAALASPIFDGFLRWAPDFFAPRPDGFLGDGLTPHRVLGSPVTDAAGNPQNYFRVQGPVVAGKPGPTVISTNLFAVQGQVLNPVPTSASLSAKPSTVKAGGLTALSGKLTSLDRGLSGKPVILERKPAGATAFTTVPGGRLTTRPDGSFSLGGVKVIKNTVFRVRFAGEANAFRPSVGSTQVKIAG